MRRITFLGELGQNTGYGQHSCRLIKGLQQAGYFVSVRPFHTQGRVPSHITQLFVMCPQPELWEIMLTPPHRPPTPGKATAYYTMWESTRLRKDQVANLNQTQLVIVPSQWNVGGFVDSGVDQPIEVVPLGVDSLLMSFREANWDVSRFVFAGGGNMFNGSRRKGVQDLVYAFQAAFPDNSKVELRLKIVGELAVDDPRIKIYNSPMDPGGLVRWYSQIHCFVSMARSEGWGLMQHEAMAIGRPVIMPLYGGLAEFADAKTCYPIFFKEVPAEELWTGHGMWAEPSFEHTVLLMREVYRNRKEAAEVGRAASVKAHQFSWAESIKRFINVLTNHGVLSGTEGSGAKHPAPAEIPEEVRPKSC